MTKAVITADTIKVCLSDGNVQLSASAVDGTAVPAETGTWSGDNR